MTADLKSDFLKILTERGYLHQATTEGLDDRAASSLVTGYIGFDCTANSLHVGSLVQIMMLRLMQRTGHKPIVLMGGGTTKWATLLARMRHAHFYLMLISQIIKRALRRFSKNI